jgi:hypothetical protein
LASVLNIIQLLSTKLRICKPNQRKQEKKFLSFYKSQESIIADKLYAVKESCPNADILKLSTIIIL